MFFSKTALLVLAPLVAVHAAPAPGLFDDLTSDVGSVFDHATSFVGSAVHAASSVVESALAEATATSVFDAATSALGTETSAAYATIVTANGVPVVEVTSVGGPAITLATSSGFTTSFAGHVFTAASASSTAPASSSSASSSSSSTSASASATSNAAAGTAPGLSTSGLVSFAAFVGSVVAGASMVL